MKRRVVVLDHTGQRGGAEIALQRLLEALDDSWDVSVVLFGDGDFRASLNSSGLDVEVLEMAQRTSQQGRGTLLDPRVLTRAAGDAMGFAGRLARHIEVLGAQLVVANSLKAAVLAEMSRSRSGLPWVWHLHDRLAPDYLPAPVVVAMRALARRATHVVANSHVVADLTRVPSGRVSVAYPGLPADAYSRHRLAVTPPVFGLLGRISSTKGQREFVEAASIVGRAHPEASFRIVGEALFSDQEYADEVRHLPQQLGVADRVEFTGWAPDPRTAIDGFSALVHASPVPEPFGQVIVEAMARSVPIIATCGGGVDEILGVRAKSNMTTGTVLTTPYGRLVGPRDPSALAAAMALVLEDPQRSREQAVHAFNRAKAQFGVARTAQTVQHVWTHAIRK